MAKRKQFKISVDRNQTISNIGAMAPVPAPNATGDISPERLAHLKELMAKPVAAQSKKDEEEDRVESLIPADAERLIPMDKLKAAPDEWNFFGRPSPEQYGLIYMSVFKYGLWHPCTVWEQEDGSYMILGGHTRHLVYHELHEVTGDDKYLTIPCKVYKHDSISEATARRIIILSNVAQRAQEDTNARIRCYAEMARLEKEEAFYGAGVDVATAVSNIFGVSRSTVFFYRRLGHLIEPLLSAFDQRVITVRVADVLADLSEELQQYVYDKQYHLKITPAMGKALKNAKTTNDVEDAINAPKKVKEKYQYVFSTKFEKPKDFDFIPLAVKNDEIKAFKSFLMKSLDQADGLSEQTKEVLLKMIKS